MATDLFSLTQSIAKLDIGDPNRVSIVVQVLENVLPWIRRIEAETASVKKELASVKKELADVLEEVNSDEIFVVWVRFLHLTSLLTFSFRRA